MSKLSDKQVYMYKQKYFPGVHAIPESLKWRRRRRRRRRKRHALKNNFIDRKNFIRQYQRNGWMDLSELRDIDSLHIEGTDTLVKGGLGWKGWFIEAWVHERAPLNSHWLVLKNCGTAPYTIVGLLILYTKNVLGLY